MVIPVRFRKWGHDMTLGLEAPLDIRRLVWHWTGGTYLKTHASYHFCVLGPDRDGLPLLTAPLKMNVKQVGSGGLYAAHTWRFNSFCAGISACAMWDAIAKAGGGYDFSRQPITDRQIEVLAWLGALMHSVYHVPWEEMYTHHEVYQMFVKKGETPPSFRWDLKVLKPESNINGGDILRGKAKWYAANDTVLIQAAKDADRL